MYDFKYRIGLGLVELVQIVVSVFFARDMVGAGGGLLPCMSHVTKRFTEKIHIELLQQD